MRQTGNVARMSHRSRAKSREQNSIQTGTVSMGRTKLLPHVDERQSRTMKRQEGIFWACDAT